MFCTFFFLLASLQRKSMIFIYSSQKIMSYKTENESFSRCFETFELVPKCLIYERIINLNLFVFRDKLHVDWTKAWVQTLAELQAYIKQNHTTGIVWTGTGAPRIATGAPPPPPPSGMPPPPPILELGDLSLDPNNDRSALFAEINQGENITKSTLQ